MKMLVLSLTYVTIYMSTLVALKTLLLLLSFISISVVFFIIFD